MCSSLSISFWLCISTLSLSCLHRSCWWNESTLYSNQRSQHAEKEFQSHTHIVLSTQTHLLRECCLEKNCFHKTHMCFLFSLRRHASRLQKRAGHVIASQCVSFKRLCNSTKTDLIHRNQFFASLLTQHMSWHKWAVHESVSGVPCKHVDLWKIILECTWGIPLLPCSIPWVPHTLSGIARCAHPPKHQIGGCTAIKGTHLSHQMKTCYCTNIHAHAYTHTHLLRTNFAGCHDVSIHWQQLYNDKYWRSLVTSTFTLLPCCSFFLGGVRNFCA